MITYSLKVSDAENALLKDIDNLRYGEIYDVELPEDEPHILVALSGQRKNSNRSNS